MSNCKVLNTRGKEIFTDITLHPADVLNDELEAREIKKSTFAVRIRMKPGHLSEVLHGKRHVRTATAIKFEKQLDITAEYWFCIQVYNDFFLSGETKKDEAA